MLRSKHSGWVQVRLWWDGFKNTGLRFEHGGGRVNVAMTGGGDTGTSLIKLWSCFPKRDAVLDIYRDRRSDFTP